MNKLLKKVLSACLAFILVLALLPANALKAKANGDVTSLEAEDGYFQLQGNTSTTQTVNMGINAILDLNGHVLTVPAGYSLNVGINAEIIDTSADKTGKIVIAQNGLVIANTNHELVPVYTGDGYIFTAPQLGKERAKLVELTDMSFTYRFRPGFGTVGGENVRETYLQKMSDSQNPLDTGVTMDIKLSWVDADGVPGEHVLACDDIFKGMYETTNTCGQLFVTGAYKYRSISLAVTLRSCGVVKELPTIRYENSTVHLEAAGETYLNGAQGHTFTNPVERDGTWVLDCDLSYTGTKPNHFSFRINSTTKGTFTLFASQYEGSGKKLYTGMKLNATPTHVHMEVDLATGAYQLEVGGTSVASGTDMDLVTALTETTGLVTVEDISGDVLGSAAENSYRMDNLVIRTEKVMPEFEFEQKYVHFQAPGQSYLNGAQGHTFTNPVDRDGTWVLDCDLAYTGTNRNHFSFRINSTTKGTFTLFASQYEGSGKKLYTGMNLNATPTHVHMEVDLATGAYQLEVGGTSVASGTDMDLVTALTETTGLVTVEDVSGDVLGSAAENSYQMNNLIIYTRELQPEPGPDTEPEQKYVHFEAPGQSYLNGAQGHTFTNPVDRDGTWVLDCDLSYTGTNPNHFSFRINSTTKGTFTLFASEWEGSGTKLYTGMNLNATPTHVHMEVDLTTGAYQLEVGDTSVASGTNMNLAMALKEATSLVTVEAISGTVLGSEAEDSYRMDDLIIYTRELQQEPGPDTESEQRYVHLKAPGQNYLNDAQGHTFTNPVDRDGTWVLDCDLSYTGTNRNHFSFRINSTTQGTFTLFASQYEGSGTKLYTGMNLNATPTHVHMEVDLATGAYQLEVGGTSVASGTNMNLAMALKEATSLVTVEAISGTVLGSEAEDSYRMDDLIIYTRELSGAQ